MFTGIIQAVGRIASVALKNGDAQLVIDSAGLDLSDEIGRASCRERV